MGSWGHKPFDNDSALDWRAELIRSATPLVLLQKTLGRIDAAWDGDVDEAQESLAAAGVVAAAGVEPIGSVDAEVRAWIVATGFVPDMPLVAAAAAAAERIERDSELRELRVEAGRLEPWLARMSILREALTRIAAEALPMRAPKRPAAPRSLYRMAARHDEQPSAALRKNIADKFAALADPDLPGAETDHLTPLTIAARHGLLAEAEALLARGAAPDAGLSADARKGSRAESVLHEAARCGHFGMVELLLDAGAAPNPVERFEGESDRWYHTPLDLADEDERPELAALLRRHGARKAVELLPEAREWAVRDAT